MAERYDILCFADQRWGCIYHRPYHLLSRAACDHRVFYFEPPLFDTGPAYLSTYRSVEGVTVVEPILPTTTTPAQAPAVLRRLLDQLIADHRLADHVQWFTSPHAIEFAHHLEPLALAYDCTDELSRFRGAPSTLAELETFLLIAADVVFVGGRSLYEAKQGHHANLHFFPSAVDTAHFARARRASSRQQPPVDQAAIPRPRVGFSGVIDPRVDLDLLADLADHRRDLQLVMVGPVTDVDLATPPRRPNLHWLGVKSYPELPRYLAGWDVALMPYARTPSTKFLSPTTLEYLAAGLPVVSTPIADVVYPYGELGLVRIADGLAAVSHAIDAAIAESARPRTWHTDRWLAQLSWDRIWQQMDDLILASIAGRSTTTSSPLLTPTLATADDRTSAAAAVAVDRG